VPPEEFQIIRERHETACARELARFGERSRITDAGNLKQLRPPGDAFADRVEAGASALRVGFAEHHVIGT
jgi:hypothetical protein